MHSSIDGITGQFLHRGEMKAVEIITVNLKINDV